ncbi:HAD-IB family hydrolase [Clostridium sp. YIM B02515]|uniref:HAD-IB family hydrolase n=1 Tax=Clostridium rhizosphaerae TaxID=2803861 RepID=A0ABS1TF81_9CLOT|nr:HAD-IB family hydrolase [Clostridium rhizosphaerae]MBL4938027.1 HAD-IB family hydrolase [Clostridium rhizosphaerae]
MEKLAIFDVDYTLTKKETQIEFYKYMLKKDKKHILHMPKVILSGILFALNLIPLKSTKEYFISFIEGIREEEMKEHVKDFYENRLSKLLYKDAIETIKRLKMEGYKIYLISASPEFYLNELYNIKEVDKIIGTRYLCENGVHKRSMQGENCKGEEKVKRLMEEIKKEDIEVDFKNSYMFSDSLSDLPLLNIVGNPYLINYKKKHDKIEILEWK